MSRARTLPDYVRPDLGILICGLNPSPTSVDLGIPFGRPGNRFWPAAVDAGLVPKERDVAAALAAGIGFTDLCKRPTRRASELDARDYVLGFERLRALVRRVQPRLVGFVGLAGYRAAVDRSARPGALPRVETARAWLIPSTSGLNAHETRGSLARHMAEMREYAGLSRMSAARAPASGGSARESNPPKTWTQAPHGI